MQLLLVQVGLQELLVEGTVFKVLHHLLLALNLLAVVLVLE
jgi:hypothetical protein